VIKLDSILADLTSPLRLEYLSIPIAAILFVALALPVIWLGMRSLNWLGATRKWVSISLRLSIIWVLVLLLCGAHWVKRNRDLEVIVLRDISTSTNSVTPPPGKTLCSAVDDLIREECRDKRGGDRIGVIGFAQQPRVEAPPDDRLHLDAHPLQTGGDGTDIASALKLSLASFRRDAMHRLVLVSDGNATQGDTDAAICTATSMGIPIDVLPLHYEIRRDVLFDRLTTPALQRENEPFSLDMILRSSSLVPVSGSISITQNGLPIDLDPQTPGVQSATRVTLRAGANPFNLKLPPMHGAGLQQFHATFQADRAIDDALSGNDTADAFTFIRGKGQVLFVDGVGEPASAGGVFLSELRAQGIDITEPNHITPQQFPSRLLDLANYDAILLANVPRGPGGLSSEQDRILSQYVRDLGGGLLVIGGPDALGAGNWHGSELEKVLPVDCGIPAERILPAGALVLVVDHSGSMSEPMPGDASVSKQFVASESAILALQTLQHDDLVGVIGFASNPRWMVNLAANEHPALAAEKIRAMQPTEGTNICPALEEACAALEKIPADQAGVKRVLLLTDGVSESGDYQRLLARMRSANITLSTVAVGTDADRRLLGYLAQQGGGRAHTVDSPGQLKQIFIREARMLRRQLIHEPIGGIDLVTSGEVPAMPKLAGMVLTSVKPDPTIVVPIVANNRYHDPIFAHWQIGLGRAGVFTSDATARWAPLWIASPNFGRFWAETIRNIARPPMSGDFDIRTIRDGPHTRLIVEAFNGDGAAKSFIRFTGKFAGPDPDRASAGIDLQQTGPGRYEAMLDTPDSGNYAAAISYTAPDGTTGSLVAGVSIPQSVELRDMQSNESYLAEIASRTGGRLLSALDRASRAGLFDREGLTPSISSHPIDDVLLMVLMGMLVTDVAVRRIRWDWPTIKHWALAGIAMIQSFTTTRKIDARQTMAALKKVHEHAIPKPGAMRVAVPSSSTSRIHPARSKQKPPVSCLSSLKAAKQRAIDEIKERGRM
jgi:Mg-chelatase subunit ChlD